MTTIMNTRLVRIGIRHIEAVMADIWITRHRNPEKKCICATSPLGISWIWRNMNESTLHSRPVVVDAESIQETIELMKKDGLTVEER